MGHDIVRVRIIRRLTGSVDGIDLKPFEPGVVYDLSTALGSYLLCVRVAEPADDSPALAMPLARPPLRIPDRAVEPPRAEAANRKAAPARQNARRSYPVKRR
jgi:hypothetical protein